MSDIPGHLSETPPLKKSPLDAAHRRLGARMVPFAGYEMPLQYRGIIAEHEHTRAAASVFDVSHMGQAVVRGADASEALEALVVGDLAGLPVGRQRYTLLTNDAGGIIDDMMVAQGGTFVYLVVNAARRDEDFAHIQAHIGDRCTIEVREEQALLALQGPRAVTVLGRLAPASRHMLFMSTAQLRIGDVPCGIARSGYTGEDGFEISCQADRAERLFDLLLQEPEVRPGGLGARDSLRLEAGLCLYGNDIDETTTPVEAGLTWTINKRRREEGGFPGDAIILRQIAERPTRRRVGLVPEGKAPVRAHTPVTDAYGDEIGEVTSGGYGPTVGGPVAMGYVATASAEPGTPVMFHVRGKAIPGHVAALPFVPHRYVR